MSRVRVVDWGGRRGSKAVVFRISNTIPGTLFAFSRSRGMTKKPIKVEVVKEGDKRFLLRVYADGSEERRPIVREPKKKRQSAKIAWYWDLKTGRRKFY